MPTKIKLTILTEDIICHTNSGLNIRIMLNFRIFLVSRLQNTSLFAQNWSTFKSQLYLK